MRTCLFTFFAVALLTLCAPGGAALAAGPVCPPGTNAGTCLNNAIAAIEQLEQRVAKLEAERGQSSGQGSGQTGQGIGKGASEGGSNIHSSGQPTCTGGQVLDAKTNRCACPNNLVWSGTTCKPKNAL